VLEPCSKDFPVTLLQVRIPTRSVRTAVRQGSNYVIRSHGRKFSAVVVVILQSGIAEFHVQVTLILGLGKFLRRKLVV
jgi:hypothetical protein